MTTKQKKKLKLVKKQLKEMLRDCKDPLEEAASKVIRSGAFDENSDLMQTDPEHWILAKIIFTAWMNTSSPYYPLSPEHREALKQVVIYLTKGWFMNNPISKDEKVRILSHQKDEKVRILSHQFDYLFQEGANCIKAKLMEMGRTILQEECLREDSILMRDNYLLAKILIQVWADDKPYKGVTNLHRQEFLAIRSWL